MNLFSAQWPFYVTGTLLALLLAGSLYVFNDPIGLSDAMTSISEYCDEAVSDGELPDSGPALDWQIALLFGLFLGALVAAASAGKFKAEFLLEGSGGITTGALLTIGGGLAGGFLMMFGVQLAGDTVWGQCAAAIQLSGGAWIYLGAMALSAATLAILLERKGGGGNGGGGKSVPKKAAGGAKK